MRKIGAKVPSCSHYAQGYAQFLCKQPHKLCKQANKKRRNFFKNPLYKTELLLYNKKAHFQKIEYAAIAQSVECILGKDEVTSSNLVSSSKLKDRSNRGGFSFLR